MNVSDIMTREVVTVGPDADIASVARLLLDHNIGAVPVVDAQNRVLGVISEGDLWGHWSERKQSAKYVEWRQVSGRTRPGCDSQTRVAQRSIPDDDHRFPGPCL